MDALLALEPRTAGGDIADPDIHFAKQDISLYPVMCEPQTSFDPYVCTPYTYGTRVCQERSKVC
jgi:hypothetical protein